MLCFLQGAILTTLDTHDMTALDYILSRYQMPKYEKAPKERAVLKALVHTLQPEELKTLQRRLKRSPSKWNVGTDLYNEALKAENNIAPSRNEPISSLLKQFTDKRSGKVATARKKLRDRFAKQDFQMQRKILKAFLSSAKQDRMWAYSRLKANWDSALYDEVKTLWEQYHEKECGQVVLRYFPTQYVYNNLSHLDIDENYTWLCIRLINHPQFQIDKGRLWEHHVFYGHHDVEYLYILVKSNSQIEKGTATRILFKQIIHYLNACPSPGAMLKGKFENCAVYEDNHPTTKWLDNVSHVLWCMGRLGLTEELIAYEEWDGMVQRKLVYSSDYEELKKYCGTDFSQECYLLFRNVIAECLPDEYKHLIRFSHSCVDEVDNKPKMSIGELKSNPTLSTLIDQLGLEVAK